MESDKIGATSFRLGRKLEDLTEKTELILMRIAAYHHESREVENEVIQRLIKAGKCHFASCEEERERIKIQIYGGSNYIVRDQSESGYVVLSSKDVRNDPEYKVLSEKTMRETQSLLKGRSGYCGTHWVKNSD